MPATTPILFPSGEDANPLNRRLPAEVVTRRRREVRKPEEKTVDEVRVDLKTALLLKPEARLKWLTKACKMAEEGKASTTELHSIVSSRKFAAGVHPKIGRRMAEIVLENLGIFSDKQQKHLKSDEWVLGNTFGSNQDKAGDGDGDDQERERDERSRSRDRSEEDNHKVRKFSEEPRESSRRREEPTVQPLRRENDRGRDGGSGGQDERSGRQVREPEPEGWVEAPAAGRQEDRARREALLAEERARRKAREREDQEKWMSVEAENAKRKALEQQQAKKKQLEEEADSSLLALERLGQVTQPPLEPERNRRRDRKASRSRSVRSISRPRSRNRRSSRKGRDGSYSVSVKRERSKSRRRRRTDRAAFDEALRRRMQEREAHDTTRTPVVDPGHAQRMLGGYR
mmetsp:Transcript_87890/g.174468  ORF Transcript_87890/g.174468 Transcript_87890/m.174468 type:complete len:401 (+) Transcript_87890:83-1285(+)